MSLDPTHFPKVLTLYLSLSQYPLLAPRIRERMRNELFARGVIDREDFEDEVREKAVQSQIREGISDPLSEESSEMWTQRSTIVRDNLTDFYFAYNLPRDLFEDLVKETLSGRVPVEEILLSIHPELAPWDMLFAQGEAYENLPPLERARVEHHLMEIKVVLIKAMISDHLEYLAIARDWFDISDLQFIRGRRIGRGKIGGKAAGVMLAEAILRKSCGAELRKTIRTPRSWFLGADVFYQFNQINGLFRYANQKYKPEAESRADHPAIQEEFLDGRFPEEVAEELRGILAEVDKAPLIVRSSSLLEDSFGTSFAGKYETHFCPNQGSEQENLRDLCHAITKVYASVYNPDALLYRQRVGLTDYDERMAILIQEIQGRRSGRYFLPDAAGVAFSRNQFRWSPRIDRNAGFLRMVWGLGTRAVEHLGSDFPRLVALSHPDLRPVSTAQEIRRYSQEEIDLIDLEGNAFCTLPVANVIGRSTPNLRLIAQVHQGDQLQDLVGAPVGTAADAFVITFDGLLRRTSFADNMKTILLKLETAYGRPIDSEFAVVVEEWQKGQPTPVIIILQCRPQSHLEFEQVEIPADIPSEDRVFVVKNMVPDGIISDIRYVVYIQARSYAKLPSSSARREVARLIGRINIRLKDSTFILIGPGRWGSNNPDLGVPVTYSDIYNSRALIEIAEDVKAAEPSYGTHFFQDLVEANIYPLALAFDDVGVEFNHGFFDGSVNKLDALMPEESRWSETVRVIDVSTETSGGLLQLVMDGEGGEAVAYIEHVQES
jgi:hypothetical protein